MQDHKDRCMHHDCMRTEVHAKQAGVAALKRSGREMSRCLAHKSLTHSVHAVNTHQSLLVLHSIPAHQHGLTTPETSQHSNAPTHLLAPAVDPHSCHRPLTSVTTAHTPLPLPTHFGGHSTHPTSHRLLTLSATAHTPLPLPTHFGGLPADL
eukprot:1149799-Pelagomonas_calceolata.AAC.2